MHKIMFFLCTLFLVSCDYYNDDRIDVEYTNDPGEEGGHCFPDRKCYDWPKLMCNPDNLRCEKTKWAYPDEDNTMDDSDILLSD